MATQQTKPAKTKRTRIITPFDEAKSAQARLGRLEQQRAEVLDGLSDEAAVMLEALEELRAKQPIPVAANAPDEKGPESE